MKLTFWGAARQVTGSMFLLETEDQYRILIDCGADMDKKAALNGNSPEDDESPKSAAGFFPFEASSINVVLLTHAHIDHSGNLPNLYREGYEGQILCTDPTYSLTNLLLQDAASLNHRRLNEMGKSKKQKVRKKMASLQKDLFLEKQVRESMDNVVPIQYNRKFRLGDSVDVTFVPAGHLLGAAHIVINVYENGEKKSICFSGDIGRKNYPLLGDPEPIPQVDYLICESTYGNRLHLNTETPEAMLADVIQRTCIDIPGRLIIPSFSVGRTQALLYTLNRLYTEQGFPPIKVFSDSPLALESTKVYQKNLRLLNKEAKDYQEENASLFDFVNFEYLESSKASREVSNYNQPCIIISSSGMVQGGRVEQHVAANISNPYCTILIIGYCAEGTLGWRLLNGQPTISIKDKEEPVLAKVERTDVFSGHGDRDDLVRFVKHQSPEKLKKVFLVHGEFTSMSAFQQTLADEGYSNVEIPTKGQTYEL
ncbi:MBL fold metallo-hydrolase RNA specificity domain-containing protein [Larkinella humicola]|uniref:MBL fold metallo-hydrolase n=1 Tax=Larkinella humicola TaxID=2607654 RepID=A0A5N1JNB8_9BACT|nr:MBL fold metallo-hydrolase [Larkinella humicola]KAA9357106.1 MBL fold metallo-hydrolase [Larkinella humicola]